jgi:ribosomal-protein-alanine N-acetyltransferase
MTLTLRYMHPGDVEQVVLLDNLSFPDPWSLRSYQFEINESKISHMVVLDFAAAALAARPAWWQRWLGHRSAPPPPLVAAYGGLWHIAEEAHISTIASHPDFRGRHYGEVVLAGMVQKSRALGAEYVVLEVRVSNLVAQNLYLKYGFSIVDTRSRYYRNGEDAYDMRLHFSPEVNARLDTLYAQVQARQPFTDHFSATPHPRLGA